LKSRRKAIEVMSALAEMGIFLIGFDGMSGRKLYGTLWHRTLWEGCYVKKRHPDAVTLIDVSHKLPRSEVEKFLNGLMQKNAVH
jgi:hypothetical protein